MTPWNQFSVWIPWGITGILCFCVLILGIVLIRKSARKSQAPEQTADPPPKANEEQKAETEQDLHSLRKRMRREIHQVLRTLKRLGDQGDTPYKVPWIITFGLDGAETRTLLKTIDSEPRSADLAIPRTGAIHFCQHGLIFHAGDNLLSQRNGFRIWQRLMLLMQACRPHRPADGLVIMLPVQKLTGPEALPFDLLADYGSRISEMISEAQHISGLRIPVTLILTGCHTLKGFNECILNLPDEALDDALGWSSPYALEQAYQPEWADKALEQISTNLSNIIIRQLMVREHTAVPDALLSLPQEIRSLKNLLRPLVAAIFQPSAYHEAFLFRGIFLADTRSDDTRKGAFIKGLFDNKIFREYQLVLPVKGFLTRRTYRQRLAQGALAASVLLSIAGLIGLHETMAMRTDELHLLMTDVKTDLKNFADNPHKHQNTQTSAIRLLQELAQLDVLGIETPLAPASYLTSPDSLLERALRVGFDVIIMTELNSQLNSHLKNVTHMQITSDKGEDAAVDDLNNYIDQLIKYDRILHRFQNLPKTQNTYDLASVVQYALHIDLPDSIHDHAALYQHALDKSSIPTTNNQGIIQQSLIKHFSAAYQAYYNDKILKQRLKRIETLSTGYEKTNPEKALQTLEELHTTLKSVVQDLSDTNYGWINTTPPNIAPKFVDALARLSKTNLVNDAQMETLRELGIHQIEASGQALKDQMYGNNIPLLDLKDGKVALTPEMMHLDQLLDQLLTSDFMSEDIEDTPIAISGKHPLMWDAGWIKTAQRLTQDYLAYSASQTKNFPQALRMTVSLAAYDQTRNRVGRAISAAAQPWAQVSIATYKMATEFQNLESQYPQLNELNVKLHRSGLDSQAATLDTILRNQTLRLLMILNGEADKEILLSSPPDNYTWWDGKTPLALRTYGAEDQAELDSTIRSSVADIAQYEHDYATPLIDILHSVSDTSAPLAERWQKISDAVTKYKRKDPTSSILHLTHFIRSDMDQVNTDNCGMVKPSLSDESGDAFSIHLNFIQNTIYKRCKTLQTEALIKAYRDLQTQFNITLAGRFPFSDHAASPFADFSSVNKIFHKLDQADILPKSISNAKIGENAARFLRNLEASRKAMPMLGQLKRQSLRYQVQAEFDTNRSAATGSNQVIEWGINFGNSQGLFSRTPGKNSAIWSSGTPVHIFVRFARNAPSIPADLNGSYSVHGHTAIWSASDPWALLTLISKLSPDATQKFVQNDHRQETLELKLRLQTNPDAAKGTDGQKQARLFLHLSLSPLVYQNGKDTELPAIRVPEFPTIAPDIDPSRKSVPLQHTKSVQTTTKTHTAKHGPRVLWKHTHATRTRTN